MDNAAVQQGKRATYPVYKPSGVEWLGDVPKHWEVRRLKYSANLINQKVDGSESDLPYTGLEHIESWTGKRIAPNGEMSSEGQANLHRRGDVLFGKLRPYLAKVHAVDADGICTGELLVLRPKAVHQHLLLDYLLNPDLIAIVDSSTYGAKMPRANWEFIGNLPVLIPPTVEQRAIAAFLDRETRRIDALIARKQRQIELLQEKRAALISHAVTKGLDPNVKMKDSGIEWLGRIPEHWEVIPLRHICESIQTGPFGSQLHQSDYLPGGIPVVNPAHIADGVIAPDENSAVDEMTRVRLCRHVLQAGDILFARRGEIGRCGLVTDAEAGWLCGTGCMRVRLHDVYAPYYDIVFNSRGFGEVLTLNAVGTTMLNINNTILARTLVPRPPRLEQEKIHAAIQRESGRVRQLTECVQRSIGLLREYRTALISAAVTGKIDVRQEAGV